jgi:hypothetical protein
MASMQHNNGKQFFHINSNEQIKCHIVCSKQVWSSLSADLLKVLGFSTFHTLAISLLNSPQLQIYKIVGTYGMDSMLATENSITHWVTSTHSKGNLHTFLMSTLSTLDVCSCSDMQQPTHNLATKISPVDHLKTSPNSQSHSGRRDKTLPS